MLSKINGEYFIYKQLFKLRQTFSLVLLISNNLNNVCVTNVILSTYVTPDHEIWGHSSS